MIEDRRRRQMAAALGMHPGSSWEDIEITARKVTEQAAAQYRSERDADDLRTRLVEALRELRNRSELIG